MRNNLGETFPNVQFIVASHSPFIVSAVRDARVYALRHVDKEVKDESVVKPNQTRFVSSIRLDSTNRAGTASQILRDVLGLPTTYPEWVSEGIDAIINKYRGRPFDEKLMSDIRREWFFATFSGIGRHWC
jgi:predicted ATP-binding protein involved in virulence